MFIKEQFNSIRDKACIALWSISHIPAIYEHLNYEAIDFKSLLTHVHPQLKDTPIPDTAVQLFCSLQHLCLYDEHQLDHSHTNALFRGSLIKRHVLGDPKGYINIPQLYNQYQHNRLSQSDDPLTKKIVEKLSHKPVEIDFRAVFSNRIRVLPTLIKSLNQQGFVLLDPSKGDFQFIHPKQKFKIQITTIPIGTDEYPRTLFNVIFYDGQEMLLNIDITDLPNEQLYDKEMRLSWKAGMFEKTSVAPCRVENSQISVFLDKSLKKYPYYDWVRAITPESYTNAIGDELRELSSLLFWPKKNKIGEYDIKSIRKQLINGCLSRPNSRVRPNSPLIHIKNNEIEYLQKRNDSLISDFLLYFTYDPFLFLYLGYESQLFDFVPLEQYIQTTQDLEKVMQYMRAELAGDSFELLSTLSNMYNQSVLQNGEQNIMRTGPFMLLRAINRLLHDKQIDMKYPENMNAVVSLLNPLTILQTRIG